MLKHITDSPPGTPMTSTDSADTFFDTGIAIAAVTTASVAGSLEHAGG